MQGRQLLGSHDLQREASPTVPMFCACEGVRGPLAGAGAGAVTGPGASVEAARRCRQPL